MRRSAHLAEIWGKSVIDKGNSTDDGPEAGSSLVNSRKRRRLVWLQFGEGGEEGPGKGSCWGLKGQQRSDDIGFCRPK